MHGNRNACRQQLGSGGRNLKILATVTIITAISCTKVEIVEIRLAILILNLGKRDRCSTSWAPVHRSLALVDPPVSIHPHERLLSHAVIRRIHRHVLAVPVNGESEPFHRILHLPYVFQGQFLAQVSELRSGDLMPCDSVCLLHLDLGRQPMAVPSLRKHHVVTPHPFISCHKINVTPIQRISNVEIACGVRRWSINDVLWFIGLPVELIDASVGFRPPFLFYCLMIVFLWKCVLHRHLLHSFDRMMVDKTFLILMDSVVF